MATKQELEWLQKLASQYGWADSQQFKDYVNTTAWTWTYDTLMTWLQNQASVQTAPAPTSNVWKIDTTTGQEVQQPIQNQPITTPTPTQVPNSQPIQEAPKQQIQAPKIEVKTDINEALNPKWQQWVDKALESGQNVKSKLDEWLKAWTIDQNTYNQANNYLTQKNQQAWDLKVQQNNDENFIFEALQTGQNIKGTTPAYNQALNRYNKMNYYKSLSDSQLWAEIGRNLLPGTTEYNDLIKDPVFKEKLTKLQQINLARWVKVNQEEVLAEKNYEILNNTNVNIAWTNFTLKQALDDWYITTDEMSSLTNSPVIATKSQEVEDLKNQYDEAYSLYKNLATDVKNQFKGTWATRRDIAVAVANAQEKLLPWLEALENRYTNALWTLTQMRTDSAQLFATNLGLYKEQQAKTDRLSEIALQREYQLEDRTYEEELAQKQLEQKALYTYWDINSDNPALQNIAIENAVAWMYVNYPIVWMESQATKVQKVKDRIAQGMTWAEAISSVEQEIRTSPAYKDLMAQQKASMTPETTQDWSKLSDTELYNQRTWEIKSITPKQAWVIDLQVWDTWWQCGTYARQYTWITTWLDAVVWTTANDRVKNFTDTEPQEWWLVLFTWWNYDKQYWHIAVVTSVNWDWTINITESNLNNDWKVTNRTVWVDEVTWFYNDTPLAWTPSYTDNQIWELSYLAELQEKNPTQAAKDMKELWYTAKDLANYKAWNMPLTEKQKNSSVDIVTSIQDLIKNYDWNDAVGKFDYSRVMWLQGAEDAKVVLDNLIAKMTLPNLWVLKWPMSDKDIQFIQAASSKLWTTQSNESFEKNIIDAYNLAARRAWLKEVTTLNEIKKLQTAQPAQTIQTNQWDYSEEDLLNSLK